MGISYDSTTIVTGGVDRNIKILGSVATKLFQVLWYIIKVYIGVSINRLNFGDFHRSGFSPAAS